MSDPITADERAAMRERYAADLPSVWNTSAAARARVLRDLGRSARVDVLRLLDALAAAEAEATRYRERVGTLDARLAALGYPKCACHPADDDSERCLPDPQTWTRAAKRTFVTPGLEELAKRALREVVDGVTEIDGRRDDAAEGGADRG